jgi:23S rRNA G2445 N2-methylase RlmL
MSEKPGGAPKECRLLSAEGKESRLNTLQDPGFTPAVRDIRLLVELLADDELAKHAERAIARAQPAAIETLRTCFRQSDPPLRSRILRAIGRFVDHADARALLIVALDDADPKTRRNAAVALGHAHAQGVEDALIQCWNRDARKEMRRSIAASLGKIGSAKSLPLLGEAARADDAELARIAERAVVMIARTESRGQRGRVDAERAPVVSVEVDVIARRGLEELLVDELVLAAGVAEARALGAGHVRARLSGAMSALFAARTMLCFRFPLSTEWVRDGDTLPEAVARAAVSPPARRIFSTWTVGAVRYRISWAQGGHRRAVAWDTARAIARLAPDLVNDPTRSLWELRVATTRRFVDVSIAPRELDDPRFAWRRRDVPAASHPTLAAVLARVAGVQPDDVVWDPFVGSGGELIERALSGPFAKLEGTDVDLRALDAARENLEAAGLTAILHRQDALEHAPAGVTLILTNPPMGRRASRFSGLADMLDRFVVHAASVLVPGGRLVWIAPWPMRSRAAATRAGLTLDWARVVDMGGFDAEIQRWSAGSSEARERTTYLGSAERTTTLGSTSSNGR